MREFFQSELKHIVKTMSALGEAINSTSDSSLLYYIIMAGIIALVIAIFIEAKQIFQFPKDSDKPIILFDGVCNLCDGFVNFVIDWDSNKRIYFANIQSAYAKELVAKIDQKHFERQQLATGTSLDTDAIPKRELTRIAENLDSIILVIGDEYYIFSEAVLRAFTYLSAPVSWLAVLLVIPTFVRTFGYRLIGRNRYLLFGKTEHCRVPTKAIRSRFLSSLDNAKKQKPQLETDSSVLAKAGNVTSITSPQAIQTHLASPINEDEANETNQEEEFIAPSFEALRSEVLAN